MKFACITLFVLIAAPSARGDELAPFTSDGCSSFPDGTTQHPNLWLHCCVKHDLAYWLGGTEPERADADLQLERCVAATGETEIAKVMLQGVRAGGSPMFPTPYRWAYGWPLGRGYQALNSQEIAQAQVRLADLTAIIHEFSQALRQRESAP